MLLGLLLLLGGVKWFEYFGTHEIQPFLITQTYIIYILLYVFKQSKDMRLKAMCLYSGIFWVLSLITDFFIIDISIFLIALVSLPLYIISAKKVVKSPITPMLSFNHNYIIKNTPFKWYHWVWVLIGGQVSAYNWFYNSELELLIRVEGGILKERKVSHELILREIKAIGAEISRAEVSYEEIKNKLGTKINCKKEMY